MKKSLLVFSTLGVLALGGMSLTAATYSDSTGENFTGAGGGILDITSVEVNTTATDLIFKINLAGDPSSPTDWGKYMIGIDSVAGGDTAGNGWGRPISLGSGMDYWFGSWVDSGNAVQVFGYSGSWSQIGGVGTFAGGPAVPGLAINKNTSSVTITAPLSLLGLVSGSQIPFTFDVYTSGGGGGDSAVDALGNPAQSIADWGNPYSSAGHVNTFTVPEPSAIALVGLGSLALVRRSLRRK